MDASSWIEDNCKFAMDSNEGLAYLLGPVGTTPTIGKETGKPVPDGIAVHKSAEGSCRYVYYKAGKPAAAIQVVSRDGKTAQVANAFTAPEFRRQGLATLLMQRIRRDFKNVSHSDDRSGVGNAWVESLTP